MICAPVLNEKAFFNLEVVNDLAERKRRSDKKVSNRITSDVLDVTDKVFSQDLFGNN